MAHRGSRRGEEEAGGRKVEIVRSKEERGIRKESADFADCTD